MKLYAVRVYTDDVKNKRSLVDEYIFQSYRNALSKMEILYDDKCQNLSCWHVNESDVDDDGRIMHFLAISKNAMKYNQDVYVEQLQTED